MQTIRIPSETCLETAVPQMQAFWIRIRQRSQPFPVRGRIVDGSSHSCHWPLAISTVLPEVITSCGKVIGGEVCLGTSWLEGPSRIQRASILSASPCLMHLPFRLSDSETECPADHRSLATGIAPVRSSGIERVARKIERVSWNSFLPFDRPSPRPRWLAVRVPAAIAAQESALGPESSRLRGFPVKTNSWRYS